MELQKMRTEEDEVKLVDPGSRQRGKWLMSENDPLPPRPESHWIAALLAMIFCCTPCGIVALVFSYLAEDYYDRRDYTGSVKMAKRALRWIKVSVVFYVLQVVLLMVYVVILLVALSEVRQILEEEEAAPPEL